MQAIVAGLPFNATVGYVSQPGFPMSTVPGETVVTILDPNNAVVATANADANGSADFTAPEIPGVYTANAQVFDSATPPNPLGGAASAQFEVVANIPVPPETQSLNVAATITLTQAVPAAQAPAAAAPAAPAAT